MNADSPASIEPEDVGRFSIDSKNRLYWDGQLVHTEAIFKFSDSQKLLAKIVAFATIAGACGTVANATAAWLTYHRNGKLTTSQPALTQSLPAASPPQSSQTSLQPLPDATAVHHK